VYIIASKHSIQTLLRGIHSSQLLSNAEPRKKSIQDRFSAVSPHNGVQGLQRSVETFRRYCEPGLSPMGVERLLHPAANTNE
jgi:hypothetical protein